MQIDETLLEICEYDGEGYRPLVRYGEWRVAVLNYIAELLPERLTSMQRHDQTDEVFVLLQGRCILFLGEGGDSVGKIQAVDMLPRKAYNIKKGCWHTHTLSQDAAVLIVENQDTGAANSPKFELTPYQTEEIVHLTAGLWQQE